MGALFSSKSEPPKTTTYNGGYASDYMFRQYQIQEQAYRDLEIKRLKEQQLREARAREYRLNLEREQARIRERELIQAQARERRNILEDRLMNYFRTNKQNVHQEICKRNQQFRSCPTDYQEQCPVAQNRRVQNKFKATTQRHFKVIEIKSIVNPYVYAAFLLRRKEYNIIYGMGTEDVLVFHGATYENIKKIIEKNFNWRLHGRSKGNIFGKGASFSPISNYASNYSDKMGDRFMLGVTMLKYDSCIGNKYMTVPPESPSAKYPVHYDTSQKEDGNVLVKYRDDEFYPSYLIQFEGFSVKSNKPQNQRNVSNIY